MKREKLFFKETLEDVSNSKSKREDKTLWEKKLEEIETKK